MEKTNNFTLIQMEMWEIESFSKQTIWEHIWRRPQTEGVNELHFDIIFYNLHRYV